MAFVPTSTFSPAPVRERVMKAVKLCGQKDRGKHMSQIIPQSELEHLTELKLRSKFTQTLDDLVRKQQPAQDCPLAMTTLQNIQTVLCHHKMKWPKM